MRQDEATAGGVHLDSPVGGWPVVVSSCLMDERAARDMPPRVAGHIEYVSASVRRRYRAVGEPCGHTGYRDGCGHCCFTDLWQKARPATVTGPGRMDTKEQTP